MRHLSALALLSLGVGCASCGGASDLDFHLSLTQALTAEVTTIHLDALDGSDSCPDLRADQTGLRDAGLCPGTDFQRQPPCVISRATLEVAGLDLGEPISLYVPAGSRTIGALGLDATSTPVAFACAGPLAIDAGTNTTVELELK